MAKAPTKKSVDKTTALDYFKLPFEVHYSEHVGVNQLEFKSDINPKSFSDIKVVHQEQGGAWGVSFYCGNNTGAELYCCITNGHDEVEPTWLEFLEEENIDFNSGTNYKVVVHKDEIRFEYFSDEEEDEDSEEYLDVDNMDYCCYAFMAYEIEASYPDYFILDADDTRIKVNSDGYVLDEDDEPTEERIFDPDELEERLEYTTRDMWEAKADWVEAVLKKSFPKQANLKLSSDTE